jgi:dihydroorotate dehydrogenase
LECFEGLHRFVDYFVLNVSCPNVSSHAKLEDADYLKELITEVQKINNTKAHPKPILLKIAPDLNTGQLDEIIDLVAETKIDGIVATNTSTNREGLRTSTERLNEIGNGGLSGKPIKERSTKVIKYLHDKSGGTFPIIGVGGIHSAKDAMEKLDAGATLLQLYTGFIYEGTELINEINLEILRRASRIGR